jgi:uncharacterized protein involved in response to NO
LGTIGFFVGFSGSTGSFSSSASSSVSSSVLCSSSETLSSASSTSSATVSVSSSATVSISSSGAPLLLLFSLWLLARLLNILGQYSIAGASDLAFMLLFYFFIFVPIIKAKKWRQFAIMIAIVMLITANGLYYAGQRALFDKGNYFGNYLDFYVVVAAFFVLILASLVRTLLPWFDPQKSAF